MPRGDFKRLRDGGAHYIYGALPLLRVHAPEHLHTNDSIRGAYGEQDHLSNLGGLPVGLWRRCDCRK